MALDVRVGSVCFAKIKSYVFWWPAGRQCVIYCQCVANYYPCIQLVNTTPTALWEVGLTYIMLAPFEVLICAKIVWVSVVSLNVV